MLGNMFCSYGLGSKKYKSVNYEQLQALSEAKRQTAANTEYKVCQVLIKNVEFVKEQQNAILEKLKSEWIAVEEDIKETTVEVRQNNIPEQVFFMPCPYPELKASLMNEFEALGEKYKSRLQSINERLEAMDRYCGWSKEDHFVFQVTVDQYPHNQQNSRALCMDMLQRFLPHKSRQELNDHQRAWDWYYFTTEQKKTLLQGWMRDKQDLVMKAVMTIKEACAAYEEEEALRNDRKRQQEICAELKEKLEQWRAYQEEVARLEAAIAARKQEEAEEKLRKEKQKETQKRTQDKIKQYYMEKQRQRDAMEKRDQQQLEELKKRMSEQAIKDKERVQFRHHILQQRLKEREEQALRRQQEEDDKKKRLDVAVEAEFDPVRMMGDTEASKAKVCMAAENEFILQRPLFSLHTYNENQILSDPRLRIEQALRDAGLHNTLYAKDVLSQITPPKPPRKGLESSVFQT
uniref:Coiled-coil domain containing 148 n=1 Tax=Erpetoichthys calabaricus TaxID=27687 RepID=A0A8C4S1Q4_ERPCA